MNRIAMRVLGAAAALGMSCFGAQEKDFGKRPDWSMTLPDGKKASASDYDGKVVVVTFWASWSPPCVKEIPELIRLQKQYEKEGLVVVGFSLDRDQKTHDEWVKENGVNFLSILCQSAEGRLLFGSFEKLTGKVTGFPTTLLLNRKGQIIHKHVGPRPSGDLEKLVKPLLP